MIEIIGEIRAATPEELEKLGRRQQKQENGNHTVERIGNAIAQEGEKMKYKAGDKVLVKATISEVNGGTLPNMPYLVTVVSKKDWKGVGVGRCKTIEVAEDVIVDMTAEEAWEIAKKILLHPSQGGFNATELEEIFGRTEHLWEMAPQEAKSKIEAWEAAKEIKVGDVVEHAQECGVVTSLDCEEQFRTVLFQNGEFGVYDQKTLKKTGRHIDIDGLLRQIILDE